MSETDGHDDGALSSAQADHPRSLGRPTPGGGRARVDLDVDGLNGLELAGPVGTDAAGCRAERGWSSCGRSSDHLGASRCRAGHHHRRIVT